MVRDEGLLADNLRVGAELGSLVHNVQIMMDHADGHLATDQEVAEAYVRAYDLGATLRCLPALEVHINMWSEDFRRVAKVATLVESRGIPSVSRLIIRMSFSRSAMTVNWRFSDSVPPLRPVS